MPYIIRCTIGERRDPTRRGRLSPGLRRDRGRLNIAGRRIKTHRPTHISDSFYKDNADEIQHYVDAGFIAVQPIGESIPKAVEKKPEPAPVAKPVAEEPKPPPPPAEEAKAPEPAPEPVPEPAKAAEPALKELPAKPEKKAPEEKKPAAKKPAAKKPAKKAAAKKGDK